MRAENTTIDSGSSKQYEHRSDRGAARGPLEPYLPASTQAYRPPGDTSIGDHFACVVARFGGADCLAVNDHSDRYRHLIGRFANLLPQGGVNPFAHIGSLSTPKDRVYGFPLLEIVWQLPPLAALADHVLDRVKDLPAIGRQVATLQQQLSGNLPLPIRYIAGILAPVHRYGSVFLDLRTKGVGT